MKIDMLRLWDSQILSAGVKVSGHQVLLHDTEQQPSSNRAAGNLSQKHTPTISDYINSVLGPWETALINPAFRQSFRLCCCCCCCHVSSRKSWLLDPGLNINYPVRICEWRNRIKQQSTKVIQFCTFHLSKNTASCCFIKEDVDPEVETPLTTNWSHPHALSVDRRTMWNMGNPKGRIDRQFGIIE